MDRMALYQEGKSDEEIAKILGQKVKTVSEWRYRYKLPNNFPTRNIKLDEDKLTQLWESGLTDREIAKTEGILFTTVQRWRQMNDLPDNAWLFNWQSKLKPSELAKIPEKYWNPRFRRVSA